MARRGRNTASFRSFARALAKNNPRTFRVYLQNVQTVGAACGYGEGKTLAEAQEAALKLAREHDPNAYLAEGGRQVYFAGGINC